MRSLNKPSNVQQGPTAPRGPDGRGRPNLRLSAVVSALLLAAASLFGAVVPAQAANKTIVSLTFDDGNANQLQAAQVLKAHGLVGTFFITTSWIGTSGYLTQANLHTLATDGNEIGGHTVTHPDLTTLTAAAATSEVCNGKTTLELGLPCNGLRLSVRRGQRNRPDSR
ncbi:putative polysaccharide deacetylase YxkH [Arthrobacter sp. Hiyo6]|nr:putative polysaccharide deacetylase YxkH [Arthrobacter sp. Hiyo6]